MSFTKDAVSQLELLGRILGKTDVESLALADDVDERLHGLLDRRDAIVAMRVEDIEIVEASAPQALVDARHEIFAARAIAIGTLPHKVTRLGRNKKFVAVGGKVIVQDAPEVRLGTARDRAIVVGQVEMRDATVESMENHALSLGIVVDAAKVVPQAKRDGRKKDTALAATAVRHRGIAIRGGHGRKRFLLCI